MKEKEWDKLTREYYDQHQDPTHAFLSPWHTKEGLNTYQILARSSGIAGDVLELGCGGGTLIPYLNSQKIQRYIGVDQSPKHIDQAKKIASIKYNFMEADARHLPFANESFDCILSHMAIHMIMDRTKVLEESSRTLKPQGKFYALVRSIADPKSLHGQIAATVGKVTREIRPDLANAAKKLPPITNESIMNTFIGPSLFVEAKFSGFYVEKNVTWKEILSMWTRIYPIAGYDEPERASICRQLDDQFELPAGQKITYTMAFALIEATK